MKKLLFLLFVGLATLTSCEEYSEPICGKVIKVETISDSERNIYWKYTFKTEHSNKKYTTWRNVKDGEYIPVGSCICFNY